MERTVERALDEPDEDRKAEAEDDMENDSKDRPSRREEEKPGNDTHTALGNGRQDHPGQAIIRDRNEHEKTQAKHKAKRDPVKEREIPDSPGERSERDNNGKDRAGKGKERRAVPGHRLARILDDRFGEEEPGNRRDSESQRARKREVHPGPGARTIDDEAENNEDQERDRPRGRGEEVPGELPKLDVARDSHQAKPPRISSYRSAPAQLIVLPPHRQRLD